MAKKKFLRQTASLKETKKALEGEPGRDHAAMIVPISIIKVEKNIRKQLDNLDELAESIKKYGISKSILFEIGSSERPDELLKKIESGEVSSVKDLRKDKAGQPERKPSGPLGGGRYVQQAIKYHENEKSGAWSLRINFSPDQTPRASREKIIKRLEEVLAKLRGS